jgi:hypothetical protein
MYIHGAPRFEEFHWYVAWEMVSIAASSGQIDHIKETAGRLKWPLLHVAVLSPELLSQDSTSSPFETISPVHYTDHHGERMGAI